MLNKEKDIRFKKKMLNKKKDIRLRDNWMNHNKQYIKFWHIY